MEVDQVTYTVARALAFSTPLLWAALGEIFAERAGVVRSRRRGDDDSRGGRRFHSGTDRRRSLSRPGAGSHRRCQLQR